MKKLKAILLKERKTNRGNAYLISCNFCGKEKWRFGCHIRKGWGKFCSQSCTFRYLNRLQKDKHHPLWRGENAGYVAKHTYLTRNYGSPKQCDHCGTEGIKMNGKWNIEWAIKKNKHYSHDIKDYLKLCHSCHMFYDKPYSKWKTKNKTGFKGVYFNTKTKVFYAQINVNHKAIYLGSFRDKLGAIAVRQLAEKKYWGYSNP